MPDGFDVKPIPVKLDAKKLHKYITVDVTVEKTKWFDLRVKIGLILIKSGAYIAGLGYESNCDLEGLEENG